MSFRITPLLWDAWCVLSIVGIWPRFVEPKLLRVNYLNIKSPRFSTLRIVGFSDLHLGPHTSSRFLHRLSQRIHSLKPDILLFTGDFLCHGRLQEKVRLKRFFGELEAKYGCFGIFGNHDYEAYASLDDAGHWGVHPRGEGAPIVRGLKKLFSPPVRAVGPRAGQKQLQPLEDLRRLLQDTPFSMLHNETVQVNCGENSMNIAGLGDLWAQALDVDKTFSNWDPGLPGLVMAHNPDSIDSLRTFPGTLILAGHTHGAQVNLPWIAPRILGLKNPQLRAGKFSIGDKTLFVTRGVGGVIPFRWFSPPEIVCIDCGNEKK